jgi:AraC-like DNA-binding protein
MLKIKKVRPINKLLFPYIDCYIHISGNQPISRIIFPNSDRHIVFDFIKDSFYKNQFFSITIIGQHEKPFTFDSVSTVYDLLIISLSPYGLSAFSNLPLNEINNQFINADNLFGSDISNLYYQLQPVKSLSERIKRIEAFLLSKYLEPSLTKRLIFKFADLIKNNPRLSSVNSFKSSIPLSTRQIERNFKKVIGTDISQYKKIIRFEKASSLLIKKSFSRLTDIAYNAGYYDQSHFISDFKMLAGVTPKHYHNC